MVFYINKEGGSVATEMPRHDGVWMKLRRPEHEAREAEQRALMELEIQKALADPDPTRIVGIRSEKYVFDALSLLRAYGYIHDFHKGTRGGELDHLLADFVIIPDESETYWIPLQVKSSQAGLEEHRQKSNILCVVADNSKPIEQFAKELLVLLGISLNPLLEGIRYGIDQKICDALGIDMELNTKVDKMLELLGFDTEAD